MYTVMTFLLAMATLASADLPADAQKVVNDFESQVYRADLERGRAVNAAVDKAVNTLEALVRRLNSAEERRAVDTLIIEMKEKKTALSTDLLGDIPRGRTVPILPWKGEDFRSPVVLQRDVALDMFSRPGWKNTNSALGRLRVGSTQLTLNATGKLMGIVARGWGSARDNGDYVDNVVIDLNGVKFTITRWLPNTCIVLPVPGGKVQTCVLSCGNLKYEPSWEQTWLFSPE
jgi:hypothetical protein